jgi:primosomal protein N' (replication factor Y)
MSAHGVNNRSLLSVALPTPLRRCFSYLPPDTIGADCLMLGQRVRVPFGHGWKIGIIVENPARSTAEGVKLKRIHDVIDKQSVFPNELLTLLQWASEYYQHSLGEVIANALPVLLRKGEPATLNTIQRFRLISQGDISALNRAPKQAQLVRLLDAHAEGLTADQLAQQLENWRSPMAKLIEKGWVEATEQSDVPVCHSPASHSQASHSPASHSNQQKLSIPELNPAQAEAVTAVLEQSQRFSVSLLEGVTGSGKTEVYLRIIEALIDKGLQALVLVPEIALTPQLISRFQKRFAVPIVAMHSNLSERERLNAWLFAKQGDARIVIGTRSAVFTPFKHLGLIVVDEEHDPSLKQQDGFRYSARDIAVRRAQMLDIPIILGSATASLESLYNALQGRYNYLSLPERAGSAVHPHIKLLDIRSKPIHHGLSNVLIDAMRQHLQRGQQVMLFLNRRGFAPTLLCHDCGWVSECKRCDSHMTLHFAHHRLRCHHCGSERPMDKHCPKCGGNELIPIGLGTERIEQVLEQLFPGDEIVRVDRDTTRRKGALEKKLAIINEGKRCVLLGTQMLAKGHHFPNVTLVGVIDIDQGLFSSDFRALERMAQLITQVAGRAGRADKPGEVLIQTHHPEHPLLQTLINRGYGEFAKQALAERQAALLPPYSFLALLRAEAVDAQQPYDFLNEAKQLAQQFNASGVLLSGPVAAPMEKRAGRFRAQLLLQASKRSELHRLLHPWVKQLEDCKSGRKVRWSLDVDPIEMY